MTKSYEVAEFNADNRPYIEGVNAKRLGISLERLLDHYRFRQEQITEIERGYKDSAIYTGKKVRRSVRRDLINKISRVIQETMSGFSIKGMRTDTSSGDNFYTIAAGAETKMIVTSVDKQFIAVISFVQIFHLDGSYSEYCSLKFAGKTNRPIYDNPLCYIDEPEMEWFSDNEEWQEEISDDSYLDKLMALTWNCGSSIRNPNRGTEGQSIFTSTHELRKGVDDYVPGSQKDAAVVQVIIDSLKYAYAAVENQLEQNNGELDSDLIKSLYLSSIVGTQNRCTVRNFDYYANGVTVL